LFEKDYSIIIDTVGRDSSMRLDDDEQKMLDGAHGELVQKCMKILVALGEIYGAEKMIPVNNVHSPGVSYRVAGDAGLNYVKDASKMGKFKISVTLNTIGIDSERWKELGFAEDFSISQLELLDAYKQMGAKEMYTCTPYLTGNIPYYGEHLAWGESSAISFSNSILGARTNREGGPSALAAAVTGRVPAYGYHLDENRKATCHIKVERRPNTDREWAILGYYVGSVASKDVPVLTGMEDINPTIENLKAISAAVASSGAVALFHIVGITPEAPTLEAVLGEQYKMVTFDDREYQKVVDKFTYTGSVDFVVIGCPHCTINEIEHAAQLLSDKSIKADMWICTSHQTKKLADKMGYTAVIEAAGAKIICDTCPVLCPTSSKGYRVIMTNSAKLAHYAPGLWNVETGLIETEDCVKAAIDGRWGGIKK